MREIYLFNIRFIDAKFSELFDELNKGGSMVVPAAPALANINVDKRYHQSLISSNFAIFDSGFLCLALLVMKGVKVQRISGLEFIREFLKEIKNFPQNSIFLVDPSSSDSEANRSLLENYKYTLSNSYQYIAPNYGTDEIEDDFLLNLLSNLKPKYIMINIGGGVQEKLGAYLQKNLFDFNPSIICTGAAIAFLTGKQTKIPVIVDKLYLGWLARCLSNHKRFVPRYIQGFKILPLLLKEKIDL